jgi:hypothetical protein
MVRWRPGGQRSLAAAGAVSPHPFTAPTERTPSKRIGQQWAIVRGSYGPMEAWRAAVPRCRWRRKSAPFHGADGADALQRIGQQWAIVRGSYGPMEAWRAAVPRCRWRRKSAPFHGADGADALRADRPAMGHRSWQLWSDGGLEGSGPSLPLAP